MLEPLLNRANRWALHLLGRDWVDYLASNTMTDFNRKLNPFVWSYELQAQVIAVTDVAEDVKTFTLLPNQHWRGSLPGQHVEVSATIDGVPCSRYYSLTALPDGCFSITVKRVANGKLSNWLHQYLRPGMKLKLGQPQGSFVYRKQTKLLFICAGSGITPCYSMIQALHRQSPAPDLALYAQFRNEAQVIFADSLRQWQRDGLPVAIALTRPTQSCATVEKPLSAEDFVARYADFRERDIYLCGPQGFMDQIIAILQQQGYDMDRLHCERFVMADWSTPVAADTTALCEEIYFQHLNQRIQLTVADQGKTLMQIAESHGVNLEVGCRKGMCGTCKLTLKQGKVSGNMLGNAVYLCSAYAASSRLVLDA